MHTRTIEVLEFNSIREKLRQHTQSGLGKRLVDRMAPSTNLERVAGWQAETSQARALLQAAGGHHPLRGTWDISGELARAARGGTLEPGELSRVASVLEGCSRLKRYMEARRELAPDLTSYAASFHLLPELVAGIERCIAGNEVCDHATPCLARLRQKRRSLEDQIQGKLQSLLASPAYRDCIQDGFVSMRQDRYTIPVRADRKNRVMGTVVEASGSGATVFIEPAAVRKLTDELRIARAQEEAEVYQILCALTGEVAAHEREISINLEVLGAYDFAFAKGRLSAELDCSPPELNSCGHLDVRQGRHPLLTGEVVPLDISLGSGVRTLVITGPNTGGKTVVLKTVGLLALMAQCGLHIPAAAGSQLPVFAGVFADIGDHQSIQGSLSTFSSHLTNIISILEELKPGGLVLLDEIGTGTDPAEGASLAAAILEEVWRAGALTIATTHYSDIKRYASERDGFVNGCMAFDEETLRPEYRLELGRSGESRGLWMAARLGLKENVVSRACGFLEHGLHPETSIQPKTKTSRTRRPGAVAPGVFALGDSVYVGTVRERGIVAGLANERGELTVLVKGERIPVNHKRLTLLIPASELYPEDYDLNTVLMAKEDRRLLHDMKRKHTPGVLVVRPGQE
ncbi:MAG: endonuclease MutS2 [Bacillota bacterium]